MSTLDILKAARALISDPARWTQNYLARMADGAPVEPTCTAAVCWCAIGAVDCCSPDTSARYAAYEDIHLMPETNGIWQDIATFNDRHTHAEVLALFDAAITRLEREAPHA